MNEPRPNEPYPDDEREHLLGPDARADKTSPPRNDRVGVGLAWGSTILAAVNAGVHGAGLIEMEPMLYIWSILVTIGFAGWVIADSKKPKRSSAIALWISFVPFIGAMFRMFWYLLVPGA